MSHVVTGEAVALELRDARLPSRALSLAIDLAVQVVALLLALLVVGGLSTVADEALTAGVAIVLVVGVLLGYPVASETLTRGRTLGKAVLGLRAVRDDGGPVRFRHALVRGLFGVVEFFVTLGVVPVIVSAVNRRGKRLGDLAAGTVVIRERAPAGRVVAPSMPPGLEGWAAQAQMTGLPPDLALAARDYLARWHELAPEARWAVGARLARAVAAHVSPSPPLGVPPEVYLAAVLAERRRRELLRQGGGPAGAGDGGGPAGAAPYDDAAPPPRPQESLPRDRGPFAPPG